MSDSFSNELNNLRKSKQFTHILLPFQLPELKKVEENGNRFYVTASGKKYPSITTVIGLLSRERILAWRKREGEERANQIARQSSNRGTKIHSMCENYLNNKSDYSDGHEQGHITMFNQFQAEVNRINNIHTQEAALYSDRLGIAGKVDCIAEFDGKLSVIDFKTKRKEIQKDWAGEHFMQCAGYAEMWEERTNIPIEQVVLLITTETGNYQVFVEDRETYKNNRIPKLIDAIANFNQMD